MMLESNVWDENSFLFIYTTWIGNDLLKIRKMNSAELILKTAYSSAIALAAILKTRSARRLSFDENVRAKEGGKETTGETSGRSCFQDGGKSNGGPIYNF